MVRCRTSIIAKVFENPLLKWHFLAKPAVKQTRLLNRCGGAYWSVYLSSSASTRNEPRMCACLGLNCRNSSHRTNNFSILCTQTCLFCSAFPQLCKFSSTLFNRAPNRMKKTTMVEVWCSHAAAVTVKNKCNKPQLESALIQISLIIILTWSTF